MKILILLFVCLFYIALESSYAEMTNGSSENRNLITVKEEIRKEQEKLENLKYEYAELHSYFEKLKKDVEKINISKLQHELYQKDVEYEIKLREETLDTLKLQKKMAIIFLVFVAFIVTLGLVSTWKQMEKIDKLQEHTTDTHMEISLQNIKVKTSFIGVVILLISAVFFWLFAKEIYKIEYMDLKNVSNELNQSNQSN